MKCRKLLSVLAAATMAVSSFAAFAVTASAAGVDDLTVISSNATFIAQDETTAALKRDTLSWNGKLLTLNGDNAYNTSKGYSVFNDTQVQNLLQVKQGRNMAVKVSGACTIDVYHDDNSSRIIQAGSTNKGTEYTVTQAVGLNETTDKKYDVDTITVPAAGVVYIGASGDVYVAAIDVKFAGETPTNPTETPAEPTETPAEPTEAPAEPTEAPVQDKLSKGSTINSADLEQNQSYTNEVVFGALKIVGAEGKKIDVNTNVIKLGGTGSTASRYVSVIPAEAGTLTINFRHGGSADKVEERSLIAATANNELGKKIVTNGGEEASLSVDVNADEEVFIYSGKSGINIVSITLTDKAEEPDDTKTATYTFDDVETWNDMTLHVVATNGEVEKEGAKALSDIMEFSGKGSVKLAVVITEIPEGVTITRVYID